jgi:hypothetical protein
MPSRNFKILGWTVLAAAVIAGGIMGYSHLTTRPTAFDRQAWLDGARGALSQDAPRLRMADGLLRDGRLIGLTRAQVDALLGPQNTTGNFRPEYEYVYWLGAERGYISIDSEWLVLRLGPDGRVAQARLVRD